MSFACIVLLVLLASIKRLWFPFKVTSELFLPMETEVEGDSVPISIVGEIILVLLDFKVVVSPSLPTLIALVVFISTSNELSVIVPYVEVREAEFDDSLRFKVALEVCIVISLLFSSIVLDCISI